MYYQSILDFLYASLPMYQRVGPPAFKKGLGNTLALLGACGDPHLKYPCIHIAGTNGKGTVSHMLAACFTAAGYKTGLYTSPHYRDFRERIRIDGRMVSRDAVVQFVEANREVIKEINPSFFEMTVALAFKAFADHNADIAIIETGLGGRLDSTNVIRPLVSVITNIGYDHMDMLGNTLPAIAREKAGIIKRGVPVVIGEYQRMVAPVFRLTAERRLAPLSFASRRWRAELITGTFEEQVYNVYRGKGLRFKRLRTGCTGPFQQLNLITALHTLDIVAKYHQRFMLEDTAIREGLSDIRRLTGYKGRWQVLGHDPLILCDSAHNAHGLRPVLAEIRKLQAVRYHFVLGFVNDKDLDGVLSLFPRDAQYYFCRPDIPRGLDAIELRAIAEMYGLRGRAYATVRAALRAAKRNAARDNVIYVGGSTFVVAEVV